MKSAYKLSTVIITAKMIVSSAELWRIFGPMSPILILALFSSNSTDSLIQNDAASLIIFNRRSSSLMEWMIREKERQKGGKFKCFVHQLQIRTKFKVRAAPYLLATCLANINSFP